MYCVNYDVVNIFEMQNNKLGTDFSVGLWAACTNRPLQNVNTAHCPRLANKYKVDKNHSFCSKNPNY